MKLNAELLAIAKRVQTQDGRATAEPMFSGQEKYREYGYASGYADGHVWIDEDSEGECEEDEPGARKVYYKDKWRTVMVAFTEKSCEDHLHANRHHFGETRIFAHSLWRNPEMIAIRAWLMSMITDDGGK